MLSISKESNMKDGICTPQFGQIGNQEKQW